MQISKKSWALGLLLALPLFAFAQPALPAPAPVAKVALPESLRSWAGWVEQSRDNRNCVFVAGTSERACVWVSEARLKRSGEGIWEIEFEARNFASKERSIELPRSAGSWPQDVRVNGKERLPAQTRGARAQMPSVEVEAGQSVAVALRLATGGDESLWLDPLFTYARLAGAEGGAAAMIAIQDGALALAQTPSSPSALGGSGEPAKGAESAAGARVELYKTLEDAQVPILTTRLRVVNGSSRGRLRLEGALPVGAEAISLVSPTLQARFEGNALELALAPGEHSVTLSARIPPTLGSLKSALKIEGGQLADVEYWFLRPDPKLRRMDAKGASPVDPRSLNSAFAPAGLAAYQVKSGEGLGVEVSAIKPQENELSAQVQGQIWVGFKGSSATYTQQLSANPAQAGTLSVKGWDLTQARLAQSPALVAQEKEGKSVGYPAGPLSATLVATHPVSASLNFPVSLASQGRVESGSWVLNLPPGWRLLAISGAGSSPNAWLASFSLWDWFVLILTAWAFKSAFGWRLAAAGVVGLLIGRLHYGAPFGLFLPLALIPYGLRALPTGAIRMGVRLAGLLLGLLLVAQLVPYTLDRIQKTLHVSLDDKGQPGAEYRQISGRFGHAPQESQFEESAMAGAPGSPVAVAADAMSSASESIPMTKNAQRKLSAPMAAPMPTQVAQSAQGAAQAGVGEPAWSWIQARVKLNGPSAASESVQAWLLPSWLHRMLSLVGLAGLWAMCLGACWAVGKSWNASKAPGAEGDVA